MANIIYKRKCTSTRDAREIIHSETNKAKGKLHTSQRGILTARKPKKLQAKADASPKVIKN
jgi:hypothetical protein